MFPIIYMWLKVVRIDHFFVSDVILGQPAFRHLRMVGIQGHQLETMVFLVVGVSTYN